MQVELIHLQGMNCYHDCVISIANHLGIPYAAAFATLWTEVDFRYDRHREAYLSKRIITNLGILGARVEGFDCFSPDDVNEYISLLQECEFAIVGMDAFHIPWNQFYRTFHGPHYFIVQNVDGETLPCFDPTYNREGDMIARGDVIAHTFDIGYMKKILKNPLQTGVLDEALEVVRTHDDARKALLERLHGTADGGRADIILLAKHIDAMISGRHLFGFYLANQPSFCNAERLYLSKDHFSRWQAVKNGLYRSAIEKSNADTIADVCDRLSRLMDEERAIAERIAEAIMSNTL